MKKKGKLVVAVPKEYFENVDERVKKKVWNALHALEGHGVTYKEVSLPHTRYALAAYYIIATAEASTNLAKYCGMRYGMHGELRSDFNTYFSSVRSAGFGAEAKRRIILGTFARMAGYRDAYYMKAMQVRTCIINEFKETFKQYAAIVAPTMPTLPPKFSEIASMKPIEQYQMDVLTVPANLAGLPHLSVPIDTMIGLHIIGKHLSEQTIIDLGSRVEAL